MPPESPLRYYGAHGPWTDPQGHAAAIDELPKDVTALAEVVRGLLVHEAWLRLYALTPGDMPAASRATLPIAQRLQTALAAPAAPLPEARAPADRAVGTCRDYALMLCSFLRQKAVPARVRCGFATYFEAGRYEDHWVTEYWHAPDRRWAVADAQLDAEHRAHLSIDFDTVDLPAGRFLCAGDAWRRVRSGAAEAASFGHGADRGEWFLRVNLARDQLALRKREVSDWDSWREMPSEARRLNGAARAWCDRTAAAASDADRRVPETERKGEVPLRPFWRR